MQSSRLQGKVLKKICGLPMLYHCFIRASKAINKNNIYLAICDKETETFCKKKNINYVKTSNSHKRALTRTAEAVKKIKFIKKEDVVIMYQGDEPFLNPKNIKKVIKKFKSVKKLEVLNLLLKTNDKNLINNPNNVKAIINEKNEIIYYSRFPIPYCLNDFKNYFIQTGLIAIKKKKISIFRSKKSSKHEKLESVDMNRLIDKSIRINSLLTNNFGFGVDTPQDLKRANKIMKKDKIFKTYKNDI